MSLLDQNGMPLPDNRIETLEKNLVLVAKHNDQRAKALQEGFAQAAVQNQIINEYIVNELNRITALIVKAVNSGEKLDSQECSFSAENLQEFFKNRYEEIREEILQARKEAELAMKLGE